MKTVFTNDMVAHVWAQQNQEEGRSSNRNFSFNGTKLYSFSTVIANFVKNAKGKTVVLFNKNYVSYSISVSQHMGMARHAVPDTVPSFVVSNVFSNWNTESETAALHSRNVRELLVEYFDNLGRAKRMRSDPDYILRHMESFLSEVRDYAKTFGVSLPIKGFTTYGNKVSDIKAWPDARKDIAEIQAIHTAKRLRAIDPKNIAKAERAAKRKDEKTREDYRNVSGRFGINWGDYDLPYRSRNATLALFTDEDKATRREKISAHWAYKLAAYRRGEFDYLPHGLATDEDEALHLAAKREQQREQIEQYRNGGKADFIDMRLLSDEDKSARNGSVRRLKPELLANYLIGETTAYSLEQQGFILLDDERAQRDRGMAAKAIRDIARWRLGEYVPSMPRTEFALLRVRGDEIETSQGARFPVSHALRAFPLIKRIIDSGEHWVRNGHKIPLGHFQIDRVTADGTIYAGCHRVQFSEVAHCYNLLTVSAD